MLVGFKKNVGRFHKCGEIQTGIDYFFRIKNVGRFQNFGVNPNLNRLLFSDIIRRKHERKSITFFGLKMLVRFKNLGEIRM